MNRLQSHAPESVLVYCYQTYLPQGDDIVAVHSARPATMELIDSLAAVPLPGSARSVHPSEICELGFYRGVPRCGHDNHSPLN